MIYDTILPPELVFQDQTQLAPQYQEVVIEGIQMLVEVNQASEARIVRLLSGNPQDYLNPRFQPGNVIQWIPKI
jgi:hypothetical protein